MKSCYAVTLFTILALTSALDAREESVDGRVLQVMLPNEDVTLYYNETKGGMSMELRTPSASVSGTKFYIGDGQVAVEMRVHSTDGIVFQGKTKLAQGFMFKKYAVVEVLPGYKRAGELAPGDIYITLPAVNFQLPKK